MNERAITIVSPVNGTAVLLEQVPDAVFADKIFELWICGAKYRVESEEHYEESC